MLWDDVTLMRMENHTEEKGKENIQQVNLHIDINIVFSSCPVVLSCYLAIDREDSRPADAFVTK